MIFDDDDDTHMGTCNDGVRVGSPASRGRMMNLVGRINRETPNTLPVAIGASPTMASTAGSSLRHIRWRGHRVESVTTVNALCTLSGDSPFYL
jgi:hypothetical protein